MPASGKEEGSEEGRGPRERATPQPGREEAGLGEGGGFSAAAAHRARAHPAQRVACSRGQGICSVIPLSPCLLLTEWLEHSRIIKIS